MNGTTIYPITQARTLGIILDTSIPFSFSIQHQILCNLPPKYLLGFYHPSLGTIISCLLLLLLLSRFSRVRLCDPIDGSPPGSPSSPGFPRQEHWSGLPFPSPMPRILYSHSVSLSASSLNHLMPVFPIVVKRMKAK